MTTNCEPVRLSPEYWVGVMTMKNDDGGVPPLTAEQAAERQRARDRMIARHKLIEAMIRNNELQLRNESARGGAEIEMHCALRDNALPGAGVEAMLETERASARFQALQVEHERLVAEREWLNVALLEFESGPSTDEHKRSGHA
jgi:hypothetical protein